MVKTVVEREERLRRAARLVEARARAGHKGAITAARAISVDENRYKAHESGRNGFGISDARIYAKAYGVSLAWLNFGIGSINDPYVDVSAETQEYIDLLETLPEDVRQSQLAALRGLVTALQPRSGQE